MTDHKGKCDVCEKENVVVYVCSSATGPISFAYCNVCVNNMSEPEWTLEYMYSQVGTEGEGLADGVKKLTTWKDGRYWTWDEWTAWRKKNPPKESEGEKT